MKQLLKQQNGAASIFIVIFFALLISVITLSFMRIVGTGQEESRNSDLSKSAYDSAGAGVEDAKRALNTYYTKNCNQTPPPADADCGVIAAQFDKEDCHALVNLKDQLDLSVESGEVQVEQTSGDKDYNQAYTCANIDFKTDDYMRQIAAGNSDLIPLKAESNFNLIKLQWFRSEDAAAPNDPFTLRSNNNLPNGYSDWGGGNTPPLIRAQLIKFSPGDKSSDINDNSRVLFLIPATSGKDPSSDSADFILDGGRNSIADPPSVSSKTSPILIHCSETSEYACTANLRTLAASKEGYYLRVTALYNQTTFRLSLYNNSLDSDPVKFNGVEPKVDITGRANDVFRRVVTRLAPNDLTQNGLANLSFDSESGICKTFYFGLHYTNNGCNE